MIEKIKQLKKINLAQMILSGIFITFSFIYIIAFLVFVINYMNRIPLVEDMNYSAGYEERVQAYIRNCWIFVGVGTTFAFLLGIPILVLMIVSLVKFSSITGEVKSRFADNPSNELLNKINQSTTLIYVFIILGYLINGLFIIMYYIGVVRMNKILDEIEKAYN
ncbi:hypothetical protein [Mycoplasma hafezii]|uniref:hypothetical protein n=1 Tax=Mycoplasma hafezii TaxID=525886 RepID=UPI003CEA9BF4